MSAKMTLSLTHLKGVGEKVAEKFARLQINTLQDLLFHLPMRYQDRTRVTPISCLQDGQYAVVKADILDCKISYGRKRSMNIHIEEEGHKMILKFFFFSAKQQANLTAGKQILCFGEVHLNKFGLGMIHPEYQIINPEKPIAVEETLTPIYPTTEGLNQGPIRKYIKQALSSLQTDDIPELIPTDYLPENLQSYSTLESLTFLHAPQPDVSQEQLEIAEHPAQQKLALEELLAHHLSFLALRAQQRSIPSPELNGNKQLCDLLTKQLPFALTNAQQRVITDIECDMQQNKPMLRLVQGDVGSGKTIVAAYAALRAIESGYQVAVMAPTELLAEQHFNNFTKWFSPLGIEINWLTGKQSAKHKQSVLTALKSHQISLIVGTHALFQQSVEYDKLGLVIVDEQHRFGVNQRLALKEKGGHLQPHQLTMTATPIPRTLAMTAYANLDVSTIDELPPGRKPIITAVIPNQRRDEIIDRVRLACQQGRQVYWVCSLIEESEALQCEAAEDTANYLAEQLQDISISLLHGRMSSCDKEQVMQNFAQNNTQLLVATTVIEVGVDVPNASLMIIENAERFGLAQLHQLRGRIGRGDLESHCILLYQHPLTDVGKQRLTVLKNSNDGFEIANQDLAIRGPGELLGTRQTGLMSFRIADIQRDQTLIPIAKDIAHRMTEHAPRHCEALIQRWIGDNDQFASV